LGYELAALGCMHVDMKGPLTPTLKCIYGPWKHVLQHWRYLCYAPVHSDWGTWPGSRFI